MKKLPRHITLSTKEYLVDPHHQYAIDRRIKVLLDGKDITNTVSGIIIHSEA